jgi:hypothetical protein
MSEDVVHAGEVEIVVPSVPTVLPHLVEQILSDDNFDAKDMEGTTLSFLQKVFEQTRDSQVMNAILQELLDSYQFLAARQFIENLPPYLVRDVDVHLLLQSHFNSFSLASDHRSQLLGSLTDQQHQ